MGVDDLLRVCKKCGVGVLEASEPERIKNCVECRAEERAKVNLRKASSASQVNGRKKSGKEIKKLEGKAKAAGDKKVLEGKRGGKKKKKRVFKSSGELCEELRSEAFDAFDGGYVLEFEGCFESVGVVVGGVKEQVRRVTEELVEITLLDDGLVSEGESYGKADESSYTTVYPCSCQQRGDGCYGRVKVVAEIGKVYDNGVVCQKTSVRVCHG